MKERDICENQKYEDKAEIQDLHDGAVYGREFLEIVIPVEYFPEEIMEDQKR
jgi:hypothetical protein